MGELSGAFAACEDCAAWFSAETVDSVFPSAGESRVPFKGTLSAALLASACSSFNKLNLFSLI